MCLCNPLFQNAGFLTSKYPIVHILFLCHHIPMMTYWSFRGECFYRALIRIFSPVVFTVLIVEPSYAVKYDFRSKLDRFTVDVEDGKAHLGQEEVSAEPFTYIKPLFDSSFEEACDKSIGKPDLTIVRTSDEGEKKRLVYIDKMMVSDGTNCGRISGAGIFKLPLHKNWLSGKKNVQIALGNSFGVYKDGLVVVAFEKNKRNDWKVASGPSYINWTYFEKFTSALSQFDVQFRVHPGAAKAATRFELRQGNRVFNFVKVGESTWAVQFPNSPWYSASPQFGVFEEMSISNWLSPFEKQLKIIKDTSAEVGKRIAAIRSVATNTSPDVVYILHDVLQTAGENEEIRKEITLLMRKMPSDRNVLAIIDALRTAKENTLLNVMTKTLRVRNPKGPVVDLDDDDKTVKTKLDSWFLWAKSISSH